MPERRVDALVHEGPHEALSLGEGDRVPKRPGCGRRSQPDVEELAAEALTGGEGLAFEPAQELGRGRGLAVFERQPEQPARADSTLHGSRSSISWPSRLRPSRRGDGPRSADPFGERPAERPREPRSPGHRGHVQASARRSVASQPSETETAITRKGTRWSAPASRRARSNPARPAHQLVTVPCDPARVSQEPRSRREPGIVQPPKRISANASASPESLRSGESATSSRRSEGVQVVRQTSHRVRHDPPPGRPRYPRATSAPHHGEGHPGVVAVVEPPRGSRRTPSRSTRWTPADPHVHAGPIAGHRARNTDPRDERRGPSPRVAPAASRSPPRSAGSRDRRPCEGRGFASAAASKKPGGKRSIHSTMDRARPAS